MKKLYHTNEARQSAIDEIARQIDALGAVRGDLSYTDYIAIVRNLSDLRDVIRAEMKAAQQQARYRQMTLDQFREIRTGDRIICRIGDRYTRQTVTQGAFYNHDADLPEWEIETANGFFCCDSVYLEESK